MRRLCACRSAVSLQRALCTDAAAVASGRRRAVGGRRGGAAGRPVLDLGPSFRDFLRAAAPQPDDVGTVRTVPLDAGGYLPSAAFDAAGRTVYIEVYGCQMNVNDSEVLRAVLQSAGYTETTDLTQADVVLLVTCAIRDSAESKIWARLKRLGKMKMQRLNSKGNRQLTVGLLGCMAERLKTRVLDENRLVDVIAGPDAYRDVPRLLAAAAAAGGDRSSHTAVNVQLAVEETYADVVPVRRDVENKHAFVSVPINPIHISIMRGCDNMCTFCIVPFTRGRERSRPIDSILEEVRVLSQQGVRQVTLLGQNVNSYRDLSVSRHFVAADDTRSDVAEATPRALGFSTVYRPKVGGRLFADLLHAVAAVDPQMRIRFTSPHPKDFSDEVLEAVASHANICKQITMPAQSGSNFILERMRRGYTKEAYLQLVDRIRQRIPGVALVSDFIAGFCGETEEHHHETLDLIRRVQFDRIFCFAYSMREKTAAHRRYEDDVPTEVKNRRVREVHAAYQEGALARNRLLIGTQQLALVQKESKRQPLTKWRGVLDGGQPVLCAWTPLRPEAAPQASARPPAPGDFVRVRVTACSSHTIHAQPMCFSSIAQFDAAPRM